jgi:triphosphoribosyl-dephospho-CoA synthase
MTFASQKTCLHALLACVFEVQAPKVGNVHPRARFEDATFLDFIRAAQVSAPIIGRVAELGVGRAVRDAVRATREYAGTNTNLGTLLLLAPLAAVREGVPIKMGIDAVLRELTFEDTRNVYEAIRLSAAAGLGRADQADVFDEPPANLSLVDAMRLAAARDLVARQFINQFADVFDAAALMDEGLHRWPRDTAIAYAHLQLLTKLPDSLIGRKCGAQTANEACDRAADVIASGWPGEAAFETAVQDFDLWLRADGHRRNPGTTADLIAAGLFVLLRQGSVNLWQPMPNVSALRR